MRNRAFFRTVMIVVVSAFLLSLITLPAYSDPFIIGGTPIEVNEQESRGLVQLNSGCSGVLLTNDLLLTAGHCINNHQNPSSVVATANWGASSNRTRSGQSIYKFADFDSERGADLALVYLTAPFQVFGSTTGFNTQMNLDEPSSVVNSTVIAYGVGINVVPNIGFGTWRTANLTVSGIGNRIYTFNPNSDGQITAPGDSGGPDFIGARLTGIHSGAILECSNRNDCRNTIIRITSGFSISIPAMKAAIQAVRATSWVQTKSTFWMDVFSDEIAETRYGWSADNNVNEVDWAQAFRSANEMCFNRGFVGGHFSGHNILERDLHGLVCSGPGAVWYDATSHELQETDYNFDDSNQVHWAQANRAATWICENFRTGFISGHFNGHQSAQPDGSKRYGLICYSAGVMWTDVTVGQYASLGYEITNVNSTHWAYAMRAANDYCVSQGFVAGYMNGHQSGELIGTVCQGNPESPSEISTATLLANYTTGAPGSYFVLTGNGFAANSQEELYANGSLLGTVATDSNGEFTLLLSTYFSDVIDYWISSHSPSAPTQIYLNNNAELRQREVADAPELNLVVDKVIYTIHLPILRR